MFLKKLSEKYKRTISYTKVWSKDLDDWIHIFTVWEDDYSEMYFSNFITFSSDDTICGRMVSDYDDVKEAMCEFLKKNKELTFKELEKVHNRGSADEEGHSYQEVK